MRKNQKTWVNSFRGHLDFFWNFDANAELFQEFDVTRVNYLEFNQFFVSSPRSKCKYSRIFRGNADLGFDLCPSLWKDVQLNLTNYLAPLL